MRYQKIIFAVAAGLLITAGPAFADHNSKNGEGWANMPNDIHNTRVETRENDNNDAFRDFVKYGEGSKTVNRFDSEDAQAKQATEQKGNAAAAANKGQTASMNKNQVKTQTASKDKARIETRSRIDAPTSMGSGPTRTASSARSGGKGGGR